MNRNVLNDKEYKGLKSLMSTPDRVRFGTVTATGVMTTVQFDGESGPADSYMRCSTYTPTIGHRVMLIRKDNTWLIVDRIV